MSERKKLVIDRQTWSRGFTLNGEINSLLLPNGSKCCLGFAGKQLCNISDERMLDMPDPESLGMDFENGMPWSVWMGVSGQARHSFDIESLIDINDDEGISDSDREEKITAIFAQHDVDVIFEN